MTSFRFPKGFLAFFVMTLFSIAMPISAYALTLDQAKSSGALGETTSGYLGVVPPTTDVEALKLQKDINRQRKEKYQSIATENGTPLSTVEQLAGKKAIENTQAGNFVQLPGGQWIRK